MAAVPLHDPGAWSGTGALDVAEADDPMGRRIHEGAGHAFFNDENNFGTCEAEPAASTWQATVAFLKEHLSG